MELDVRMEMIFEFLIAACESVKKCYEAEFICPICGGKAKAIKSTYNGHIHAHCEKCGISK